MIIWYNIDRKGRKMINGNNFNHIYNITVKIERVKDDE